MLQVYASEHLPHTVGAKNAGYNVTNLEKWWGDKRLADITAKNCRAYAAQTTPGAARRDLEVLRASIGYWHKEYGPLANIPAVVMPRKSEPKDRWLTRKEAARLLWAARHTQHLRRFILIGLYTGNRPGVTLKLRWAQVDLESGAMRRRASGEGQDSRKRKPPVRLGQRILTHLRRWKRLDGESAGFLCHYNGAGVTKLRRSWVGARKRAKLDAEVTPHTLRHTRATWMMQAGVSLWEAAGALGMTVEVLTRVYGHHHPDWQKQAAGV